MIVESCVKNDPDERPDINALIHTFYNNFLFNNYIRNGEKEQQLIDLLERNGNQLLDIKVFFTIGLIYADDKYVPINVEKMIHYYSLSSDQNYFKAQFNLGLIYYERKYIKQDINKAIHYFTLAAEQNYPNAQYLLGEAYSNDKYYLFDMEKAFHYYSFHYYSFAAENEFIDAQFELLYTCIIS